MKLVGTLQTVKQAMGGASCCPIPWPSGPRVSRETTHNDTAEDEVDLQLLKLGYRAELARAWGAFDNVTFSFAALHCIGGIRVFFYIVLSAGGPAAMWSSWVSGSIVAIITAANLAEAYSTYPAAGSIYYWACRS